MMIRNFSQFLEEAKNPCWTGYKQVGLKKKNGKMVPNCVPLKESTQNEDTYTFDELSKEAKEKAIEANYDIATEWDWWDPIIEGFTEDMEKIGMRDIECEFSGFYSQGDGASFTGKVADTKKFLESLNLNPFFKKERSEVAPEKFQVLFIDFCDATEISIERTSQRYVHENSISAEVYIEDEIELELDLGIGALFSINEEKIRENLEQKITDWARRESKKLYRSLEKYYEELTSPENIAEDLRSGGYRFDKKGNLI